MNKFKFYISYNNLVIILRRLINKLHAKNFKPINYSNYPILDIKPYISSRSIIVIDDIQDDRFFLDYVKANNIEKFEIFQCDNKFVGVINNH